MDVEITELEKIDATRVDGVGVPANGIPILLMKSVEPVEKDWAEWDAEHEGQGRQAGGKRPAKGNSKRDASDAFNEAKRDLAREHKGEKLTAAERENAHDVHEAHEEHEEHEAKLEAEGKAKPAAKPKPAAKKSADDREAAKSLVRGIIAKAVGADGEVDEEPDVEGGTHVLEMIADLIIAEAQELKAGQAGEICDILELACAAEKIWCWRTGEEAVSTGSVMPATMLMQSAAGCGCCENCKAAGPAVKADMSTADLNDLPDSAFAYIEPGGTKDSEGKTTPRSKRHFAIHDKAHADNAAARASQSPFGDKAMPKIRAAQREFGEDTGKSQIAEGGTSVDTVTQDDGLSKAVEDAIAKATAPLKERIEALGGELAKVKATPIPGGPMMTAVTPRTAASGEDWAAKARYYRDMADTVSADPKAAADYRQLARQAEEHLTAS